MVLPITLMPIIRFFRKTHKSQSYPGKSSVGHNVPDRVNCNCFYIFDTLTALFAGPRIVRSNHWKGILASSAI